MSLVEWWGFGAPLTGIGLHTPASVHYGTAHEIRTQRAHTLDAAFTANPDRSRGRRPTPPALPTIAWINDPNRAALIKSACQMSHTP
jgi:putative transposase